MLPQHIDVFIIHSVYAMLRYIKDNFTHMYDIIFFVVIYLIACTGSGLWMYIKQMVIDQATQNIIWGTWE